MYTLYSSILVTNLSMVYSIQYTHDTAPQLSVRMYFVLLLFRGGTVGRKIKTTVNNFKVGSGVTRRRTEYRRLIPAHSRSHVSLVSVTHYGSVLQSSLQSVRLQSSVIYSVKKTFRKKTCAFWLALARKSCRLFALSEYLLDTQIAF